MIVGGGGSCSWMQNTNVISSRCLTVSKAMRSRGQPKNTSQTTRLLFVHYAPGPKNNKFPTCGARLDMNIVYVFVLQLTALGLSTLSSLVTTAA